MKSIFMVIILALFLYGCSVSSSGILKMGPDTYTINIEAPNVRTARKIAYEQATQECTRLSKEFLVQSWSQSESGRFFDLIFRCLPAGDPELSKRPTYESRPDVLIENKQK